MKTIPLTNSSNHAIVDDADFSALSQFKWREHVCNRTSYAIRSWRENGRTHSAYMHRQLLSAPKGVDVDHEDNNGLNNQRHNIRIKTRAANLHRSRPIVGTVSGLKGVFWSKQKSRWVASITIGSRKFTLGSYSDKFLAAFAHNVAAKLLHGDDTYQNLIPINLSHDRCDSIRNRVAASISGKRLVNQWR